MTASRAISDPTAFCSGLAYTGQPLPVLLVLGALCVVLGLAVLFAIRNRSRAATIAALAVICVGFTVGDGGRSPAEASTPDCWVEQAQPGGGEGLPAEPPVPLPLADPRFGIEQTTPIQGLAPGVPPTPIVGRITNHSADAAFVAMVTVSIGAITKAPMAAPGSCDASDYTLVNPAIMIDRNLLPGESVDFTEAAIGFNNKSLNQDACQGATLVLEYVSS